MANRKLELKITTDSSGRAVNLDNLSLHAAKSLNTLLDSLIKIVDATPNNESVRVQLIRGSATIIAEGSDASITAVENDFKEVLANKSIKHEIVSNWKHIQGLVRDNGLNYEINFYGQNNRPTNFVDQVKNRKAFR